MSFWSRNKNKKDQASNSAAEKQQPPAINTAQATAAAPATLASAQNGSIPSPATSYSSGGGRGMSTSPPSSPSSATGVKGAGNGTAPFPWSMRKFRNANHPFPRFGHAANVCAGKEGEIYVFGGLVKEKRKNDLYVIDSGLCPLVEGALISGSMTAYVISATGEGPSPRLGHASILVGNAFIGMSCGEPIDA